MSLKQRPSQTSAFWQTEFRISDEAIEALYNYFLETGEPRFIDDVCLFFVKHTLEAEERAIRTELQQGKVYQSDQDYQVNEKVVFPHFNYAVGSVIDSRPGYNPLDGDFTILEVEFGGPSKTLAAFAANLKSAHPLSTASGESAAEEDGYTVIQKIFGQYQHLIRPKVEQALKQNSEFVEFNQQWFLAGLLVEVQEGLLNIVDAAIDINAGPLNVDVLIEQLELQQDGEITSTVRFSVNHRLENDPRFINVGTEERILWYLDRLKPSQAVEPPHNLIVEGDLSFDPDTLPGELRSFLTEIDDEATPVEFARPVDPEANEVTFVLTYPHRRSGTLPALPGVRNLLPETSGRLVALNLIDGQTGDVMLAWFVSQHNYIFGLGEWFQKHKLPVGAYVVLKKTEKPLELVLDFTPQRTQRDWIRIVTVKNNQLIFEMRNRPLSCRYDELMVLGEESSPEIDALWAKFTREKTPLSDLIVRIFPELMKLTSQSAVHINTLYSAINVARRCPPGPLLQELASHSSFVWMGHGYWTYKPS
jgi:hypothetical protein